MNLLAHPFGEWTTNETTLEMGVKDNLKFKRAMYSIIFMNDMDDKIILCINTFTQWCYYTLRPVIVSIIGPSINQEDVKLPSQIRFSLSEMYFL